MTTEINWLNNSKTYKKCPKCSKGELDIRVKRGRFVKTFLFFLDLKRYKCSTCGFTMYLNGPIYPMV